MKILGNKIIRVLVYSDIFIVSGFGLVFPIFAVFITEQIKGATLEIVGLASTVYLLTRSFFQLPAARLMDKVRGWRDDYLMLIFGSLIISLVPITYIFVKSPLQLFSIQGIYGIGCALAYPAWQSMFIRHSKINGAAFPWGVYDATTCVGSAVTAGVGGFLAERLGFGPVFLLVALFSFAGSLLLLIIAKDLKKEKP